MIGCVGKGAATSATTRQTRMSVLPWKGRTEFAGDEGVEGAEAGGEFGGGFSFLRVAFHAAGNQVAVGIAPRARLRHDVVQALDRRRGAAQTVEALLALEITDRRRHGASWSSNCFQTSSAFGFLAFIVGSRVGIRGVESSQAKEKTRLNTENTGAGARSHKPGEMRRKKKKGKTAPSRSFTRELVYHS